MIPEYLNKINSDKKAIECADILEAGHPTHSERLWLVGFLKFCGYSMIEVTDLIQEHAQWADYNGRTTTYHVGTVFHQRPQRTQSQITQKPRKWDLTPVEVLRIRRQKSIGLSKLLCEENNIIPFPHPERLGHFNSWSEFLKK
jgi:hypothetical protein